MSPKSLQLTPHCPFPDINCLDQQSNSCFSYSTNVVGDFVLGMVANFLTTKNLLIKRSQFLINGISKIHVKCIVIV